MGRLALGLAAVVGLAAALRLPGLAEKPLHYDEGVNGWLTLRLYWWNLYRYDPSDYHGPLLYYANLLFFHLLGPSETALRAATALAGALLPLALLPARRFAGDAALVLAGCLLAVSPGMVYFSRTAIHEIWLVFATALWAAALARFAAAPGVRSAAAAAAAAALGFASKETALLTAGSLGAGAALAWLGGRPAVAGAAAAGLFGGRTRRLEPAVGPAPQPAAAVADLFGGRTRRQALAAWTLGARRAWLAGALVFLALVALLFSSFLFHPRGVADFFAAYGPWTGYGLTGRNQAKAFGYYWRVMAATEGPWRWLALAAALFAAATRERLGLALAGWAGAAWLAYSALPYKTPWCVLEIDLPVACLVAWAGGRAAALARDARRGRAPRLAAAFALAACLAPAPWMVRQCLTDRERFDDFRRPYIYYQTFAGFHDMLRDLFGTAEALAGDGGGPRVVNVELEFPLSFYTLTRGWRPERTRYLERAPTRKELLGADLVLSGDRDRAAIDALLAASGGRWHREPYSNRPGLDAYVWYPEALWERYQQSGGRATSAWPRPARRPLPAPEPSPESSR
jgi:uncharacterized protein (TIGR03663 family)